MKKNWKNKLILTTANETEGLSVMAYSRSVSIWNILGVQFLAQPTGFSLLQSIGHCITSYPLGYNHRDKAASSDVDHSPPSAAKHSYLYCLHVAYDAHSRTGTVFPCPWPEAVYTVMVGNRCFTGIARVCYAEVVRMEYTG
jgi:hypothetical protein